LDSPIEPSGTAVPSLGLIITDTTTYSMAYNDEQVKAYLEYIGIPPLNGSPKDLEYLTRLQKRQLLTIPFENLALHYSSHYSITLDLQELYHKFINRRHGGYCMQNNSFFEHMLRAIGFEVFSTGARVRPRIRGIPSGPYLGW